MIREASGQLDGPKLTWISVLRRSFVQNTDMVKWFLFLLLLVSAAFAQDGFVPRDADEAEAYKLYAEYRKSKAREGHLEESIQRNFSDAFQGKVGHFGILGVDREAAAAVKAQRAEVDALRQRQQELLSAWELKFYWRYGDLRWAIDTLRDPKTGRQMDRIEFALIYFRFCREQAADGRSSTSFRGVWKGPYTNTRNEPGVMALALVETGGKVTGTDDGLPILDGKRVGDTMTWRLEKDGGFAKGGCTWSVTVQILDGGKTLVHKYTGHDHRTDKDSGSYSGGATLIRQ